MNKELKIVMEQLLIDTVTIEQLQSNSNPNQKHFLYIIKELEKKVTVLTKKIESFPLDDIKECYVYTNNKYHPVELMELSYLRFLSFRLEYITKFGANY